MQPTKQWNATTYTDTVDVSDLATPVIEKLGALPENAKILDLGCGDGRNTLKLQQRHPSATITGVDYSQSMIDRALELNVNAYQGDASRLYETVPDLPKKHFDGLISISAIHWVQDSLGVAKSMAESLKTNGKISVEFAHTSPLQVKKALCEVVRKHGYKADDVIKADQWRAATNIEWRNNLKKTGFDDITIDTVTRNQPLEGEQGMRNWLETFAKDGFLSFVTDKAKQSAILDDAEKELRKPQYGLYQDGQWHVTYRRYAITATKEREVDLSKVNAPTGYLSRV